MEQENYYEILGVEKNASLAEITSAKNQLAKKYHPDANMKRGIDTTRQMQQILEAYRILSDEEKRKSYDKAFFSRTGSVQPFEIFDLSKDSASSKEDAGEFVHYWRLAEELSEILLQSEELFRQKEVTPKLSHLSSRASALLAELALAGIEAKYCMPEIMNWLLFCWYQNRNYTPAYLTQLYEEHVKHDFRKLEQFKRQQTQAKFLRQIKRLLKF